MVSINEKKFIKLIEDINSINVNCAEIKERMKNINETVNRHEKSISDLYSQNREQYISIAKITGVGIAGGAIGGLLVAAITHIL